MEEVKESDAETEKTGAASSGYTNDNSDGADRKPVSFQGFVFSVFNFSSICLAAEKIKEKKEILKVYFLYVKLQFFATWPKNRMFNGHSTQQVSVYFLL